MSTSHARLLDAGHGARVHVHTGHGRPRRAQDEQVAGQPGARLAAARAGRRPDGDPARDPGAPLPRRLGLDRRRASLAARERLEHWRAAVSGNGGPDPDATLAAVRAAVADDLDTPTALAVVDAWADLSLAGTAEPVEGAPGVIARTVDALLGIRL